MPTSTTTLQTLPFLLHILVETPAALTFILAPSSHLPPAQRPAPRAVALVFRSLGGLLLATNLLALVFLTRPAGLFLAGDDSARLVACVYAFWHLWPCYRAAVRLGGGVEGEEEEKDGALGGGVLGGPVVHLGAHGLLLILFVLSAFLA